MNGIHVYNTFWAHEGTIDEIFTRNSSCLKYTFSRKNSLNLPAWETIAITRERSNILNPQIEIQENRIPYRNCYLHLIDPWSIIYWSMSTCTEQTHYTIPRLCMRTEAYNQKFNFRVISVHSCVTACIRTSVTVHLGNDAYRMCNIFSVHNCSFVYRNWSFYVPYVLWNSENERGHSL